MPMQKIIETSDFSSLLKNEVAKYDKAMFVYSATFAKRDAFDKMCDIPHVAFSNFEPNPDYESIIEGGEVFRTKDCDCLVSIGGGSSIDVAKGIKYILKNEGLVHIAIPTTTGTGCESTQFAVVYKEGKKISLDSAELLPDVAILDGSLVSTLSDFQKRCTLLDALCQCIESHWSINSTEESRKYSLAGLDAILHSYKLYLTNDLEANRVMMRGANLSGQAINITRTTAPHALSYVITKEYGIPHGCAVAMTIIQFWNHLMSNLYGTTHPMGEPFMKERLAELSCIFGGGDLSDGPDIANRIIEDILPKIDTGRFDAQMISSNVDVNRLKNFPSELDTRNLEMLVGQSIRKLSLRG